MKRDILLSDGRINIVKMITVTKSGVWLLTAQKSLKRPRLVGKKVCFILDAGNAVEVGKRWVMSVQQHAPLNDNQGARPFIDRAEGLCRNTVVSSDSHLEIGHRWSNQRHLCFRYS